MYNESLNKAFGEKLFNFMLFTFGYLVFCHPTQPPPPLCSHAFDAMQSIMLVTISDLTSRDNESPCAFE